MSNDTTLRVNPATAAKFCVAVIRANRAARAKGTDINTVPLMIGQPGIGKTAIARQIAKKLGYDGTIVITPTIYNIFDLRGLPVATGSLETGNLSTVFAASKILPEGGKWLVLIDELADIPLHEQSGFYQLFLERRVGDYVLPDSCDVVGATNDETHGACANPLSSAIKTRVAAVHVQPDVDQSVKYAVDNGWNPRVVAFIKAQPDCLLGFDKDDFAGGCTPRGLEQLSNLENESMPEEAILVDALCQGHIGKDFGMRYSIFRSLKVPSVEEVFNNPATATIPAELHERFLYCCMLMNAVDVAKDGTKKMEKVLDYAKRLDKVEAVGLVMDCCRKNSVALQKSTVMKRVADEYGELLRQV